MEAKKRNVNLRLPKTIRSDDLRGDLYQINSERRHKRFEMSSGDMDLLKHLHSDIERTSSRIRELNQISPERVVRTCAPSPVAYDYPEESSKKLKKFLSAVERENIDLYQENALLKAQVDKLKVENARLRASEMSEPFYDALGEQVSNVLSHIQSLPSITHLVDKHSVKDLKRSVEDRDIAKTTVLVLGLLSEAVALEHERFFDRSEHIIEENELDKATNTTLDTSSHIKVVNYTPKGGHHTLSIGHSPQFKEKEAEPESFEDYLSPCGDLSVRESFVSNGDEDYLRLMGESEEMLATIHAQSERIARLNQEICSTMQSSKRLLALKEKPQISPSSRRSAAEMINPFTPTNKVRRSMQ
mmetsp:Transcript_18255/g.32776  ORF Transcript_18255/g.32776 Transcript_18255/m.32776 type:complete len:358 (+) Transcript_18255:5044-6117(+)|eukprot:CAMPEP_0204896722 /NCGR_PEP_ID=MMETSP1397-20131031/330_1 /ASSEMBLY_ACC=CAM_ASM_000891 /TAXON_ID=49980 /ORGANISM="Climacostomum Climacostomum virens, Strain Stock W-24" /LENGTH=357 /DNA_ID=CAMNT_0052064377 /DNA_START=1804 /DNA_END=2877 /DNA_ORIENTATION=-